LRDQGIRKETLATALADKSLIPIARRAIELRLDRAHASANKFKTMLAWRADDGRVRGAFRYHGASTGRWSGQGVQLQNLKRPVEKDISAAIDAVAAGDIENLRALYRQPMAVIPRNDSCAPRPSAIRGGFLRDRGAGACMARGRESRNMGAVRRDG
jgi:hypothetical protein